MYSGCIKLFYTLVLVLVGVHAYGMGASVTVSSVEFLKQGSNYTGLGQMTREARFSQEDNIIIDYTLQSKGNSGEKRRLWDDDGLATLFIYHRGITTQIFNKEISESSPLPQPVTPLLKALDMLKTVYLSGRRSDIVSRIDSVSRELSRARLVSDIRSSGLESLINDLFPNHTYKVEVGNDKSIRKKIDELVAVGTPSSLTDSVAARCRDVVVSNWRSATSEFIQSATSGSDNSLPTRGTK